MAAINPEVDSAVRFSSWYEEKGLSRSTAFRLLSISGIEPEKRRVEGSRSPVSFLSGDQQQKLDFLALELKNGKTLPELESRIVKAQDVSRSPESAPEEAPLTKPSHLLQRLQALELAQRTGLGLSTAEVSWLLGVRPGSSSFVRGNVVIERQSRNCWTVQADLPG
jgi:hypothetical protein